MSQKTELWHFVASHLANGENVMLLVVAESSGSSPGRQGYKMAVGADGELCGSIGGGVMEVALVAQARSILSVPPAVADGDECRSPHVSKGEMLNSSLIEQIHRKDSPNSSGMICSGKQTVLFKLLTLDDAETVEAIINSLKNRTVDILDLTPNAIKVEPLNDRTPADFHFDKLSESDFEYKERLGSKNDLIIIGGGHCALALSELMSKMDFHISIFDDRPDLNTIEKNNFAHEIKIIDSYERIGEAIPSGTNVYVVVMTLGYRSDALVIRELIDKDFKYFGVLGSKAKMKTLLKELNAEGYDERKLASIRTPVGLPINSRTPEEIAVSIAAEIISVKNS